jgi:Tfp pilus assembly protein PilW
MTLVEVLVASAIASIVLTAVAMLTIYAARSVLAMTNYSELDRISRNALDVMTRDIRQANGLMSYTSSRIVLVNPDTTTCTYTYDSSAGTLTRADSTSSKILLTGCDQLSFAISQRSPSNDFTFFPATLATAKLVDVSWKCSRQIKARKVNTESIQTAKIVMRN